MELTSDRGTFASFQHLRAAYLASKDGAKYWLDPGPFAQDDWQADVLHASEIGGCVRATMYRLLGTPEKPRSESSKANRAIMFWAGYRAHFLSYSALNWAGLLLAHEEKVALPDGWTGRLDARFLNHSQEYVYDMKTVLPNALKYSYDMPKEKDCLQIGVYAGHTGLGKAVIEYTDRAGSNTPMVCEVDGQEWAGKAAAMMVQFEEARDSLPDLPPTLDPVYSGSYWKRRGEPFRDLKSITYAAPWNCGYCDYHLTGLDGKTDSASACHPYNEPQKEVATFKTGHLLKCESGHEQGVERWLGSHLKTVPIPEEEE